MLRRICAGALIVVGFVGGSIPSDSGAPRTGELHLFLLAGQSNMAGRGEVPVEDLEPIPGVWALQKDGSWGPAVDPLHWDKLVAGVGIARSFARAYSAANPGVEVGFIPTACGGSSLESWKPGTFFPPSHSFPYDDALARVRAVRDRGELKGMLWHQGEADSSPERSVDYPERLVELFGRFRTDLKSPELPILVGQLGQFPGKEWSAGRIKVDAAHRAVADADSRIVFVSSEGLGSKADLVHFDTAALKEFGLRYAAAWQRLMQEPFR